MLSSSCDAQPGINKRFMSVERRQLTSRWWSLFNPDRDDDFLQPVRRAS
jgi:hypothetical protein